MPIEEKLAELEQRRGRALALGGPEKVERQHRLGKLTVRERVDRLVDPGSFREWGQLATHSSARAEMAGVYTAADGVVTGFGRIDGRPVCLIGEDFTVLGGSQGFVHAEKKVRAIDIATREMTPLVWMLDGSGARAQEKVANGLPPMHHFIGMARLSGIAPQVGMILGPCAGDSSLVASLCEFIVMVDGIGMMAAGGPPVVKAAIGHDVTKEELGGVDVHTRISGVADNPAKTEDEAFAITKRFLSYLPTNAWRYPPSIAPTDDPNRREDALLRILPDNPKQPYDMKRLIGHVVDRDSFFEIKPRYAREIVTGFARLDGHAVGIVANQPMVMAGSLTTPAAQKARHFVDLCSAYHVPLVFFHDVPGVLTGPQAERTGALRAGLALAYAVAWADVPKFTVVIRKSFGMGSAAMCSHHGEQTLRVAWPTADFASLPPEAGMRAQHKAALAAAEDPEALLRELVERNRPKGGAFDAAERITVDDVIDPRETRPLLIDALTLALGRRDRPAAPTPRFGVMP